MTTPTAARRSRKGRITSVKGRWDLDGFDRKGQQQEGILIIISVLDLLVAGRARPRLPRAGLLLLRRLRRHLPRRLTEAAQGANEQVAKYNLDKVIAPKHSHSLFFRNEARQEAGDRVPEAGPAQGVSEATAAAAAAGDDAEAAQDPPRPQGGFAL